MNRSYNPQDVFLIACQSESLAQCQAHLCYPLAVILRVRIPPVNGYDERGKRVENAFEQTLIEHPVFDLGRRLLRDETKKKQVAVGEIAFIPTLKTLAADGNKPYILPFYKERQEGLFALDMVSSGRKCFLEKPFRDRQPFGIKITISGGQLLVQHEFVFLCVHYVIATTLHIQDFVNNPDHLFINVIKNVERIEPVRYVVHGGKFLDLFLQFPVEEFDLLFILQAVKYILLFNEKASLPNHPHHNKNEFVKLKRLDQEIRGPFLHGFHDQIWIMVACDHNNAHRGILYLDCVKKRYSANIRKPDV
ncbi:MAG: hypothetical protein A4E62_03125 [Syntrophorhabdus sp. PtaU1.Bin002]|nr:MAG: hypothetical protein A4E62_03125 [Syntrophorhabdus sp. PtaU1.Bin002]